MTVLEFTRRDRKWSQKDLGDLPSVRIHQVFISQIERGVGIPTPDQRVRLARALGVAPERLLDPVVVTEETARA
jgi:transcriptional regulator with XRE-family HTH domain